MSKDSEEQITSLGKAPKMSKEAEVQISVLGKSPKTSKDSQEQISTLEIVGMAKRAKTDVDDMTHWHHESKRARGAEQETNPGRVRP